MLAADLIAAVRAAQPGVPLGLAGDLPALRLKAGMAPAGLVLDLSGAVVTGPWYISGAAELTIRGGLFRGPEALRFDDGRAILIDGAEFEGPRPAGGVGARFRRCQGVTVTDSGFRYLDKGVALEQVQGFTVTDNGFWRMASDGVYAGNSQDGQIARNTVSGTRKVTGTEHRDGVQLTNIAGFPPCARITIEDNAIIARSQGIQVSATPDLRSSDLTIRRNKIVVGEAIGINARYVDGLALQDNRVSTLAAALYQAKITVPDCTGVVRCGNTVAAYGTKPAVADPPCAA